MVDDRGLNLTIYHYRLTMPRPIFAFLLMEDDGSTVPPSSHAEARSCQMYVPQDWSRPPGTGSVQCTPKEQKLVEKKKKPIICWDCNWLYLLLLDNIETSTTQRREVTSTAGFADGGLSEFFLFQRKK
jgi:hypothetical protein